MTTGTLLSLGHGYSARALSRRLVAEGWRVTGTTRSAEKAGRIRAEEAEALLWPPEDPRAALEGVDHVLVSAGPDESGDPALALFGEALEEAAGRLAWVGYLSTTGVYGDHGGAWVDETTPPAPGTRRGAARAEAERAWLALFERRGVPVHVFRLGGIYGPGRSPFGKLRDGTARRIAKPGQVFGRIHVDDIATVLRASMASPAPGAIYNVVDDVPEAPEVVLAHAAGLIGIEPPAAVPYDEIAPTLSPMARSFYAECKRVSNARVRRELGVAFAYPSYREGLAATLAAESGGA